MDDIQSTFTLSDALPLEQARVRALLIQYRELGPRGAFGAAVIEGLLRRADEAILWNDPVAMLRAYQQLQGCK